MEFNRSYPKLASFLKDHFAISRKLALVHADFVRDIYSCYFHSTVAFVV